MTVRRQPVCAIPCNSAALLFIPAEKLKEEGFHEYFSIFVQPKSEPPK